ncbi:nitrogen fixation protein FixH [Alphaproteobacteria bacterium GH1-50]|uniref:Nitrogen fixation protein FixH n=1 Tax=Kangsaoukella pontilimi TaxID=2691042 RepID=A0A7C9ITX5_9RHOB|nr:FixH family protein [Kangsaoukella pontilimi]MXQ09205.1 nitrogen fixation protein FixH [Kangsaoukella pontilimi]
MSERQITGRQVFFVTASAFAVIIAVNMTMAFKAVSTFPGLEVKNSYVASQSFDARRAAQEALGWDVALGHENGTLSLAITDADGRPVRANDLSLLIGRKTTSGQDQTPEMTYSGGQYSAPVDLASGHWTVRLKATAPDGTPYEKRLALYVPR